MIASKPDSTSMLHDSSRWDLTSDDIFCSVSPTSEVKSKQDLSYHGLDLSYHGLDLSYHGLDLSMLSGEATNTNFIAFGFGFTRLSLEYTVYHTR
jgi:hypothetical protein